MNYYGIIRNKSGYQEHLKAMIIKLYDKKDILITEGYTSMWDDIDNGKAISFKVQSGYVSNYKELKVDIYPWFTTCK